MIWCENIVPISMTTKYQGTKRILNKEKTLNAKKGKVDRKQFWIVITIYVSINTQKPTGKFIEEKKERKIVKIRCMSIY